MEWAAEKELLLVITIKMLSGYVGLGGCMVKWWVGLPVGGE